MENNPYFRGISLDLAASAQLPEDGNLPGLSSVTLSGGANCTSEHISEELERTAEQ